VHIEHDRFDRGARDASEERVIRIEAAIVAEGLAGQVARDCDPRSSRNIVQEIMRVVIGVKGSVNQDGADIDGR
jgi:hypothetical protein